MIVAFALVAVGCEGRPPAVVSAPADCDGLELDGGWYWPNDGADEVVVVGAEEFGAGTVGEGAHELCKSDPG